jgi:hypothetical protein
MGLSPHSIKNPQIPRKAAFESAYLSRFQCDVFAGQKNFYPFVTIQRRTFIFVMMNFGRHSPSLNWNLSMAICH